MKWLVNDLAPIVKKKLKSLRCSITPAAVVISVDHKIRTRFRPAFYRAFPDPAVRISYSKTTIIINNIMCARGETSHPAPLPVPRGGRPAGSAARSPRTARASVVGGRPPRRGRVGDGRTGAQKSDEINSNSVFRRIKGKEKEKN